MANEERRYFVFCDDNCKFEGMTKEQIIAAIAEATGETPIHIDDAFITKIKEQNRSTPLKFWIGSQAEYNALEEIDQNTFYIFDDTDELPNIIAAAEEKATEICEEYFGKQGVVLYDGEKIETGTPVHIPSLTDYKLVEVNLMGCGTVICSVENNGTTTRIKGLGNGLLGGNTAVFICSVLLEGTGNDIDANKCSMFSNNNGTINAPTIAYVNKIIGIL